MLSRCLGVTRIRLLLAILFLPRQEAVCRKTLQEVNPDSAANLCLLYEYATFTYSLHKCYNCRLASI
jgi:hypothetical protein